MVRACVRGWRPGRAAYLVLGLFLLGGVFLVTGPTDRLRAAPAKGTPKGPPVKGTAVPWPTPLKLTIVAEDPDVPEMAKVINRKLEEEWKANKVVPSRYADDYEFIRRASLDVIGRIAKPEEIKRYLQDPPDRRRSLLIERLLASPEYATHWANVWSNWLLTRSGPFGQGMYHDQMAAWLKKQFEENRKYNEIVEQLLTAKGKNTENGAVNFILAHVGERVPAANQTEEGRFEMVPLTSRITRLFLGVQVQCCQCHNHPFYGNLKQADFWGVNAFLRQVERKGSPVMRRNMPPGPLELEDNPGLNAEGKVSYEQRNGVLLYTRAKFLGSGEEGEDASQLRVKLGADAPPRRQQLATFVVGHSNFPRAVVNRMWGVFFGKGFVNPVDDFNEETRPTETNGALLDEMAARFKHYNYDLKKLIRWVCNSNAYNLSYVANRTNDKPDQEVLFSRMLLKSLSPEQLFESLQVATTSAAYEDKKVKKDLKAQWLKSLIANFGDDEGNEVNFNGTVVQALMMMNGKDINDAITRDEKGTVAVAITRHRGLAAGVIQDLYLASLNRPPTAVEVRTIVSKFPTLRSQRQDMAKPQARYHDLFWALLNSNEFLLNH